MKSALRGVGGTLADIACVRVALAGVELAEEIERRKQQLVLGAAGVLFTYTALILATFLLAAIFWDTHRLAALAMLTLVHLACGAGALLTLRRHMRASPAPFASTRSEIALDLAAWRQSR